MREEIDLGDIGFELLSQTFDQRLDALILEFTENCLSICFETIFYDNKNIDINEINRVTEDTLKRIKEELRESFDERLLRLEGMSQYINKFVMQSLSSFQQNPQRGNPLIRLFRVSPTKEQKLSPE